MGNEERFGNGMTVANVEVMRPDIFPQGNGQAMVEVASTRAAQEVQAAMVIAKKFPRNEEQSIQRILQSCKRKLLAEQSTYAYPKGGQTVEGPSIRLAEVLAQSWGNIDFGVIELEQRDGESTMMSYAWDLETNSRNTKIFTVRHQRHTRKGVNALFDPRDIYELTANQGARRLRACILAIIPGDVVDVALAECEKTMSGNGEGPLIDRVRTMASAFAEMGVTVQMIEKRIGHKLDSTGNAELNALRKIYRSLKDNMAQREDFFPTGEKTNGTSPLEERLKQPHPTDEKQTIDRSTNNLPADEAEKIIANALRAAETQTTEKPEADLSTVDGLKVALASIGEEQAKLTTEGFNAFWMKLDPTTIKTTAGRRRVYEAAVNGAVNWLTGDVG